jgi:S1-C subfamily serine protease
MRRVVIRHLSGSKAHQVEEFPLEHLSSLTIGRDPSAPVRFHPDRDDLVSREHARIDWDSRDDTKFTLTDLGSRNGTLLNKRPVNGGVSLSVGDVVQLGPGGPEFQFDLEPPPRGAVKATRVADANSPPPTRVSGAPSGGLTSASGQVAPRTPVGRETVERLIAVQRHGVSRTLVTGGAVLLGVIALVTAFALYTRSEQQQAISAQQQATRAQQQAIEAQQDKMAQQKAEIREELAAAQALTPAQIATKYAESVVYIEFSWKLLATQTGQQVYHRYMKGKPAYLLGDDGKLMPWPWLDDEKGTNMPIGSAGSGTGFVVTDSGFIMTNRHVAASWHTSYVAPLPLPGELWAPVGDGFRKVDDLANTPANREALSHFVPAQLGGPALKGKKVEGRLDYLDVTFRKNKLRVPARLTRTSDRHDVALIKVDLPTSVPATELFNNYDKVGAGDAVTVMGYPGISPDVYAVSRSHDPFNRDANARVIPDPTTSTGNVGRVIRGNEKPIDQDVMFYYSHFGDVYQLTVNSTGAGNSGGPVFDDRGRVIGVYFAGANVPGDAAVSYAVPIRYGEELMDVRKVIQ